MQLSEVQIRMLLDEEFHVDGWCTPRGREAAAELHREGLVTCCEGGDSQYTSLNYRITEKGRRLIASIKNPG